MDNRIERLEGELRRLRRFAAIGVAAGIGIGGLAVYLTVRSPSSLRVGRVVIDGDKVEIVATDRTKGAKLDEDGLFVQDPKAVMSLHSHELWMAGRDHKINLWLDETPTPGTNVASGTLMFAMESLHGDSGFQTEVRDGHVMTVWRDGRGDVRVASERDQLVIHGDVVPPIATRAPSPPADAPKPSKGMPF